MTYPCEACGGAGETTVNDSMDPQRAYTTGCDQCWGTRRQRCESCSDKDAMVRAWVREHDAAKVAHMIYYCEECFLVLAEESALIVAVDR